MKTKLLFCLALVLGGLYCNCDAAIAYPKGPDGGKQAVAKSLDATFLKFLKVSRVEDLTIADPYQVYGVDLRGLAAGRLLPSTRSVSWDYLIMRGTNVVGMEQLIANDKIKALKFNGLFQTDFSDETLEALRIAEQLPQIKKSDYEVRRLDCAPILFVAVWLHGKSGDIIIPLGATFGRWEALQPYSEREMIKLLKPEAKKKLAEPPGLLD